MDISSILNFALGLFTVVAGGGWFINVRQNKNKQTLDNINQSVDLFERMKSIISSQVEELDRLFEKQTKSLSAGIGNHDIQHQSLVKGINEIKNDIALMRKEFASKIKSIENNCKKLHPKNIKDNGKTV